MRFSAVIFAIAAIALGSNAAAITRRDTDNTAFTCPAQQHEALCCIDKAEDGDVEECDYGKYLKFDEHPRFRLIN
jgi:hypothetical protein